MAMDEGVNYTAGLPIVRTSPAHGTAYDIAGQGIASESSFRQAIYTALDVYRSRLVDKAIHARPLRKLYHEKHDDSHTLRLDQEDWYKERALHLAVPALFSLCEKMFFL